MADRNEDDTKGAEAMGATNGEPDAGADRGEAAPVVAHEPVSCPNEGCGAPPGTSWAWASDQGAAVELFGKCVGCLIVAGELNPENAEDEKRVAILKLAAERGVPVDQAMEPQEIDIGTAILMKLEEIHQTVKRDGAVTRLGVGALIRMQTGGNAALPEQIVRALGIDPSEAESEATRQSLAVDVPPGFNPAVLKAVPPRKH